MSDKNIIKLHQEYLRLSDKMYSLITPYQPIESEIVLLNRQLINELDLEEVFLKSKKGVQFLSGNTDEFGPLYSQAYAGHQYGYYTRLGDGRAVILGEVLGKDKRLYDLQLKGSGKTPYSRRGDGKATLYSMLREYLISEAMYYLDIPTTRSLAVLDTNESIIRIKPSKGGILCRVAASHIRVGTFQYAREIGGKEVVKELADFAINRHYPNIEAKQDRYRLFLRNVIKQQASLIAKWQSIGFVHGVMNTDNMTISGETIDYGPCAFLDQFTPSKSFSSIDSNGRYAYNQQPYIGSWNLARLAETLLDLLSSDSETAVEIANEELKEYQKYYETYWNRYMALKIGIENPTTEEVELVKQLLILMEKYNADFTNTFAHLTLDDYKNISFYDTDEFTAWFQSWTRQLGYRQVSVEKRVKVMEKANPRIIPRNHLVEEALAEASNHNKYTKINELLEKLKDPFNYRVTHSEKFLSPGNDKDYVTYCGT